MQLIPFVFFQLRFVGLSLLSRKFHSMKIVLLHAALVLFLVGCGKSDQEISDELHAKIRGDWYVAFENTSYINFSFEDSIFIDIYDNHYSQYRIHVDTLIIDHKRFRQRYDLTIEKYKIIHIGKDWMKLAPLGKTKKRFESFFDKPKDTVTLRKIHPKNTIRPTSIGAFIGSSLFGPALYLEIKSNREIVFFERNYSEGRRTKRGKLSHSEYNEIMQSINKLPLNSLKDRYQSNYSCGSRECALTINFKQQQKRIYLDDLYSTSVELQLLFSKLYLLQTRSHLQKPSTQLYESYFFKRNIGYVYEHPLILLPPEHTEPK